jgi:energy-converting hydrogenase A subunit M
MNSQWTIWVQHQTEEINEHRHARKVEVKKAEKIIKTSTATMQAIFQLVTKLLACGNKPTHGNNN